MENLHFGNGISVLDIMKNLKNGHHFRNIQSIASKKCKITTNPLKVWVSVDENRILMLAIMKKIEKWPPFHKYMCCMEKFQITNPPQSLDLWFSEY